MHEKWGGLLQAPMPSWLGSILAGVDRDLGMFEGPANHVLLNAYEPGEGILVCLIHLPTWKSGCSETSIRFMCSRAASTAEQSNDVHGCMLCKSLKLLCRPFTDC